LPLSRLRFCFLLCRCVVNTSQAFAGYRAMTLDHLARNYKFFHALLGR
jgi:hypothetical protein